MWIQIRSMDGKKSLRVDGLSKLTKIEDLRDKLVDEFEADPEEQRLFYRGKQLENGHTLFDYNVGLNEIVQILVRKKIIEPSPKKTPRKEEISTDKENVEPNAEVAAVETTSSESAEPEDGEGESTYKLGDIIDVRDAKMGAWFESKIMKIKRNKTQNVLKTKKPAVSETKENGIDGNDDVIMVNGDDDDQASPNDGVVEDDGFLYHIVFEGYEEDPPVPVPVKNVRPRARVKLDARDIEEGQKVLLNYNYDEPTERGYWYDAVVTKKQKKNVIATVYIGEDLLPIKDCNIKFSNEIFAIEKPGDQLNINSGASSPAKRTNKADCDVCKDNPQKKCKQCACHECGDKKDPNKTIMCDECDSAWHLYCLNPPLVELPEEDEWFCPLCKNDDSEVVKAGEKLKESKKKAKMASSTTTSKRDWGKGMACAGRQKTCSVVPSNHFGPIPGVEVGQSWKFRVGVSEAGVHRPHVAGIAGKGLEGSYSIVLSGGYEDDQVSEAGIHRPPVAGIAGSSLVGSQSIVLSGGYEDDKDDGEVFTYTGSGGRDLSGNKRTAEQSCDQVLTNMNLALARNVAAPLDKKNGADAGDKWREGKSVRVVRNYKGAKHSKYAPEEGNRYDGIYKVTRYWPEKGKSGFIVWRYEMRRDDPVPPPWTEEGQKRIEELGLEMQFPEGYQEKEAAKEKEKQEKKAKGGKGKRKRIDSDSSGEASTEEEAPVEKKPKKAGYKVPAETDALIKQDTRNKKVWDEALEATGETQKVFYDKIEELVTCAICMELPVKPVTTECGHNVCKSCLQRSFKAEAYGCPACRNELGKDYKMNVNSALETILNKIFPGYAHGR